ncbi:MAG: EndoU domain-containing protein [Candidatus Babeliales bacterium]
MQKLGVFLLFFSCLTHARSSVDVALHALQSYAHTRLASKIAIAKSSMAYAISVPRSINIPHIFCGKQGKEALVGLHSHLIVPERINAIIKAPSYNKSWQAEWYYNNQCKRSTFFPVNFSAHEVIDQIIHVLDHVTEIVSLQDGWRLVGVMANGEQAVIVIHQQQIKTAYPIVV